MNFTIFKLAEMLGVVPGDIICIKDPRHGCENLCNYYKVTKAFSLSLESISSSFINVNSIKDLIDIPFEVVKPKKVCIGHLKLKQLTGELLNNHQLQIVSLYMCIYAKSEPQMEKKLFDALSDWHNKGYMDYEIYEILKRRVDKGEVEVDGDFFGKAD